MVNILRLEGRGRHRRLSVQQLNTANACVVPGQGSGFAKTDRSDFRPCLWCLRSFFFHDHILAPALSTASISASDHGRLRKRAGSSFRSQTSPCAGCTEPNCLPVCPPIPPYGSGIPPEGDDACDDIADCVFCLLLLLLLPPSGPCCIALLRYCANDSGRLFSGAAG